MGFSITSLYMNHPPTNASVVLMTTSTAPSFPTHQYASSYSSCCYSRALSPSPCCCDSTLIMMANVCTPSSSLCPLTMVWPSSHISPLEDFSDQVPIASSLPSVPIRRGSALTISKHLLFEFPSQSVPMCRYSAERVTIKKRFGVLLTQQPKPEF